MFLCRVYLFFLFSFFTFLVLCLVLTFLVCFFTVMSLVSEAMGSNLSIVFFLISLA